LALACFSTAPGNNLANAALTETAADARIRKTVDPRTLTGKLPGVLSSRQYLATTKGERPFDSDAGSSYGNMP